MPNRCAVDGCQTGRLAERKRMKLLGKKQVPLFSTPKSLSLLNEWNDALSGNEKKLSFSDYVCQLHFQDEDVETHFVTVTTDGMKHSLERARCRLRDNAIPLKLSSAGQIEATDAEIKATDQQIKATDKEVKATDQEMKTTDEEMKATDAEIKVTDTEIKVTDKEIKVTDEQIKFTDKEINITDEQVKVTDEEIKVTDEEIEVSDEEIKATDEENKTIDEATIATGEASEASDIDLVDTTEACKLYDKNKNDGYSIETLARDLRRMHWKEGWVWFRRFISSSIEFVHYDTVNFKPRIYCSISSNMEITLFVDEEAPGISVGTVTSFAEMMAQLDMMEELKVCVGTGHQAELRAADCPGFLDHEESYRRRLGFERCRSCRAVRHKIQKRKVDDKDSQMSGMSKKLRLLKKRHRTLQETMKKLKTRVELFKLEESAALKKK